jgi:hypothetical protein
MTEEELAVALHRESQRAARIWRKVIPDYRSPTLDQFRAMLQALNRVPTLLPSRVTKPQSPPLRPTCRRRSTPVSATKKRAMKTRR